MATRLALAIALVLALWPASVGHAQGTQGMFPDPISTPQLMDYADRLGLSDQQRLAFESAHDVYKQEFRALRDGAIAAFLTDASSMNGMMPRRDKMMALIKRMETLQGKIEAVDDHLFERFLPVLTEAQISRLPRVRLLRERQCALTSAQQVASMTGGRFVDVSELVRDLDLPSDILEVADPILSAYERRLTADLRKLNTELFRVYVEMFDRLAAAGFEDVDFMDPENDPEEMARLQETMQQITMELMVGIRDNAGDVTKDERRTMHSIAELLPTGPRLSLRTAYYSAAYPSLRITLPTDDVAWVARAIDDPDVPAETREAMRPIVLSFLSELEWLTEEGVKLLEAQRDEANPFEPNNDLMREHQEERRSLRDRAAQAHGTFKTALNASVGKEEQEAARRIVGVISSSAIVVPEERDNLSEDEARLFMSGQDPFISPPLRRTEIRTMAGELGLDEGDRAVLETLHDDYVAASMKLAPRAQLEAALRNQWSYDPVTETATPPDDQKLEEIARLRRATIEAIRAADDAFFGQVALVVDEERRVSVERQRLQRARAVYTRSGHAAQMMPGSAVTVVDLSGLFAKLRPAPEDEATVASILSAYEIESVAALRAQQNVFLDIQRENERWNARTQHMRAEGEAIDTSEYQKTFMTQIQRVRAAGAVITELDRTTLDAMREQLPAEVGRRLERAYAQRAHPEIFDDAAAVETHLTKALALDDLSDTQRSRLQELAASYRPAYDALCDRLLELTGPAPDWGNWDAEQLKAYQENQSQLARLKYDRNELSHRAAQRIRSILDESQLTMIGGVPAPADGP